MLSLIKDFTFEEIQEYGSEGMYRVYYDFYQDILFTTPVNLGNMNLFNYYGIIFIGYL